MFLAERDITALARYRKGRKVKESKVDTIPLRKMSVHIHPIGTKVKPSSR